MQKRVPARKNTGEKFLHEIKILGILCMSAASHLFEKEIIKI